MSEIKELPEREEYEVLPPNELLDGLVMNMRLFDELKARRDAMMTLLAETTDLFDDLDIELEAVPSQPPDIAYKALGHLISKNRLAACRKRYRRAEKQRHFC